MPGAEALEFIANLLSVKLDLRGAERIPETGPFFLLANHPTGITDGIAVYDAIKRRRPDAMFYANSDAHRVCARFIENLIPVEWVLAKRTRERTRTTLKMTDAAIAEGRPIVIFPAGRLARKRGDLVLDPEWMASAASLALCEPVRNEPGITRIFTADIPDVAFGGQSTRRMRRDGLVVRF